MCILIPDSAGYESLAGGGEEEAQGGHLFIDDEDFQDDDDVTDQAGDDGGVEDDVGAQDHIRIDGEGGGVLPVQVLHPHSQIMTAVPVVRGARALPFTPLKIEDIN